MEFYGQVSQRPLFRETFNHSLGWNRNCRSYYPISTQCSPRKIWVPYHTPHLGSNNPHSLHTPPLLPSPSSPHLPNLSVPPLRPRIPQKLQFLAAPIRAYNRISRLLPPFHLPPHNRALTRSLTCYRLTARCTPERCCTLRYDHHGNAM
jgi:hypothetical protein